MTKIAKNLGAVEREREREREGVLKAQRTTLAGTLTHTSDLKALFVMPESLYKIIGADCNF